MGFIILYITYPSKEEAKKVVSHLLDRKLIACGNIFPITSAYWWNAKIENSDEFVSIVKTRKKNWRKVESEVKRVHSYELPCIMKIDVSANKEYEEWINSCT